MEDTIKLRTAMLVPDATSTDDSRNIKVRINIQNALPFISASQVNGTGKVVVENSTIDTIEYNKAVVSLAVRGVAKADFINAPYDPEMPDRFTPFSILGSIGTNGEFFMYHDKKFGDYILLPNMRAFGDTDKTKDFMNHTVTDITGFVVGSQSRGELITPILSVDNYPNLPAPTTLLDSKTHKFAYPSGDVISHFGAYGFTLSDEAYFETTSMSLTDFASLGSSDTFAPDGLPIYRAIDFESNRTKYVYVGVQKVDDVLIPLPF